MFFVDIVPHNKKNIYQIIFPKKNNKLNKHIHKKILHKEFNRSVKRKTGEYTYLQNY